ncbi:hypothetical protein [Hydrogenophaga sp.]|uniref:hypothetical protein n=1 Tax=Hydrogenophaga sp. TaxID=1904254 RepID=UPI00271EE811|nr:hypothetical protein [Hydrogenophaga sp.]MDO9434405.1 hypothetical protein [Hydrogenophaga sp.]
MKRTSAFLVLSVLGLMALSPPAAIADDAAGAALCKVRGNGRSVGMSPLEAVVRKQEAYLLSTKLLSKIIIALDKVASTDAPASLPATPVYSDLDVNTPFGKHVKFVLDAQVDMNNMSILIESPTPLTEPTGFINTWKTSAARYVYRKRFVSNVAIAPKQDGSDDYSDVNCLRTIKIYGVGNTFGIFDPSVPLGASRKSHNFIEFDRFNATFKEVRAGVFRQVAIEQMTESHYGLPEGFAFLPPGRGPFEITPGSNPPRVVGDVDPLLLQP